MSTITTQPRLLDTLTAQWATIAAHPVPAWQADPGTARWGCPAEVIQALDARPSTAQSDAILWPLLRRAWDGDQIAARTLLHAFMPCLLGMNRTAWWCGVDDADSATVEALWTAIMAYPQHLDAKVAANIAWGARSRIGGPDWSLRRARRDKELNPMAGYTLSPDQLDLRADEADTGNHQDQSAREATSLLRWAQDTGVLTDQEIALLARMHLTDQAPPWSQVAAELGISNAAARKRYSRAMQRLARAVADRFETPVGLDEELLASYDA